VRFCGTKYCRNICKNRRNFCNTCNSRKFRSKNPEYYCYITLKNNSKRRRKNFNLTFEEFKKFAIETKYIAGKGRSKQSLTIDRIDNSRGYSLDNIQILTKSENCSKRTKILNYDWRTRHATVIENIKSGRFEFDEDELPF